MFRCVFPGSAVKTGDGISLHDFPNLFGDNERRQQWLIKLGAKATDINSKSRVCRRHFNEKDFVRAPTRVDRLKPDAIPFLSDQSALNVER